MGSLCGVAKSLVTFPILGIVSLYLVIYDIVSFPIYVVLQRPWNKVRAYNKQRSRVVAKDRHSITIESLPEHCELAEEIQRQTEQIDTLDKLFRFAVKKHKNSQVLGTREVHGEEEQDGIPKLNLGEYKWLTLEQMEEKVDAVARGLRDVGIGPGDSVAFYADTCADWLVTAMACFRNNISVVTIYTNLGGDGLLEVLNDTRVATVVVSEVLLSMLNKVLPDSKHIKRVIYFESQIRSHNSPKVDKPTMELMSLIQVENRGKKSWHELTPPKPQDIAVVMYTSGSTRSPKGVLLTHFNLSQATVGSSYRYILDKKPTYTAVLPLAHIFELIMEMLGLITGTRMGYSSPYTVIDCSIRIKSGQMGDASKIRPTVMVLVPIVLTRMYKGIKGKIEEKGYLFDKIFHLLYNYKLWWTRRGFDCPVLNATVFAITREIVGGKTNFIVSGGAPLLPEVQDFLATCLCCPILQGYGLTETSAISCMNDFHDSDRNTVGHPVPNVTILLENWEEGGYTVNDTTPRGEIVIGCPWVAKGYIKAGGQESGDEFFEEDGIRWFRTGDIGELLLPKGVVRIIDRKKDLIKLQMGEYVSLGKIEAELKTHALVETVCVCANPFKKCTVALVLPLEGRLRDLVGSDAEGRSMEELCNDEAVTHLVLAVLQAHAVGHLQNFEIPRAIALVSEEWTQANGLLTTTMKLRRKQISETYKDTIEHMYLSLHDSLV